MLAGTEGGTCEWGVGGRVMFDSTGANIPAAAAEGVGVVRGEEWSVSRSILPTEVGCGIFPGGATVERWIRWKSD